MYVFGCQRTGGALKKQTFACLMDLDWHIYIFTYIHIYMFTYLHFYIYTYIYTYLLIRIFTYSHIYIYTYTHTYIYIHILDCKKTISFQSRLRGRQDFDNMM